MNLFKLSLSSLIVIDILTKYTRPKIIKCQTIFTISNLKNQTKTIQDSFTTEKSSFLIKSLSFFYLNYAIFVTKIIMI